MSKRFPSRAASTSKTSFSLVGPSERKCTASVEFAVASSIVRAVDGMSGEENNQTTVS
jgi:hypothetical protein